MLSDTLKTYLLKLYFFFTLINAYNYVIFKFKKEKCLVYRSKGFNERPKNTLILLERLYKRDPELLENKMCIAFFKDRPPDVRFAGFFDLAFSSVNACSSDNTSPLPVEMEHAFYPLPEPSSIGWPSAGIEDPEKIAHYFLDTHTPPEFSRIFWRGAPTHPVRRVLAKMTKEYPDILDVKLIDWSKKSSSGSSADESDDKVSLKDHRKYKYLIDCPGNGYSARLKWLLATGRPVFVVERAYVEFWHKNLIAWKHFIPVKGDLSDLLEHYQKIEADPSLYASISKNAQAFFEQRLFVDDQLKACAETLKPSIFL